MNHGKVFTLRPLSETDGRQICGWRYEPPYDEYNWPEWERMAADGIEFADPAIRQEQYCAVYDEEAELCGFAQFFPLAGVTRLGLGLRPDLCGRGLGQAFVEAVVREAARRAPDNEIDLEVLVWNHRALKVYEKAGFVRTDTYERMTPAGMKAVHCMVYMPDAIPLPRRD